MPDTLPSWNDRPSTHALTDFVARVTTPESPDFVEPASRIAVFDNDGTLWCEKPMPVEMGFMLQRLAGIAQQEPALRDKQPWKAAYTKDYAWLGDVITKHYHGDDSDVKVLAGGILKAFEGMTVEDYEAAAQAFLQGALHPTLKRRFPDCAYSPMVELLRYLEIYGFTNYIVSGGDRDFMRVITDDIYSVPAERVVGTSNALRYTDDGGCGKVSYLAKPDVFDDGPVKPVRIWSRIGRRPIVAVGNSNGDIPMLQFTGGNGKPALRVLLRHDDEAREFAYDAGAETALELAMARNWSVISMKDDWKQVFAEIPERKAAMAAR